jgi:hypothetical protein
MSTERQNIQPDYRSDRLFDIATQRVTIISHFVYRHRAIIVMVLEYWVPLLSASAQGGPPLLTDDPGTPGPGHWEVNIATTYEAHDRGWILEIPLIDANYGVGNSIQLKVEGPWLLDRSPDSDRRSGPGNMLLGVKWRFLDHGEDGFAISMYPQLEIQTPGSTSYRRGLVTSTPALLLPIEVTHPLGPVYLNAEAGYEVVHSDQNFLIYGLALGRALTKRVEVMGEIHGTSTLLQNEPVVNIGTRVSMTPGFLLLLSGGHTLGSTAGGIGGASAYAAAQLLL